MESATQMITVTIKFELARLFEFLQGLRSNLTSAPSEPRMEESASSIIAGMVAEARRISPA